MTTRSKKITKAPGNTPTRGNDEQRQILEQVSGFIERYGAGRFSDADRNGEIQNHDRAGWWRDSMEGRVYLFTADGLREALKGFDFKRALDTLQKAGAIPASGADGKRAKFYRISGQGVKLYPVQTSKLVGNHGSADLLATMEPGAADTPCNCGEVSAKPAPILACTPDTCDTPQNDDVGSEAQIAASMTDTEECTIWTWFDYVGEKDRAVIESVLKECFDDPEARKNYLCQARKDLSK